MALIKCKECGHEVSDKASACPNCGCPITTETIVSEEPVKKSKGKLWFLLVLLLCLLVGGGYYAYAKAQSVHPTIEIYVSKNNGPFALKTSKSDYDEVTASYTINF